MAVESGGRLCIEYGGRFLALDFPPDSPDRETPLCFIEPYVAATWGVGLVSTPLGEALHRIKMASLLYAVLPRD